MPAGSVRLFAGRSADMVAKRVMRSTRSQTGARMPSRSPAAAKLCAAAMMLETFPCALMAQTAGEVAPASQNTQADQAPPAAAEIPSPAKDKRLPRGSDKRRAADL